MDGGEDRRRHRRIAKSSELRYAPRLGSVKIYQLIWKWCCASGAKLGLPPWKRLGAAFLQLEDAASLVEFIQTSAGAPVTQRVGDWLQWWAARPQCSSSAFSCSLKASPMRGLWIFLQKKGLQQSRSGGSKVRAIYAGRQGRGSGVRPNEVGRLPLHPPGALPAVIRCAGVLQQREWLTSNRNIVAGRDAAILKARLAATVRRWPARRKEQTIVGSPTVAASLAQQVNGELVISLARWLRLTKGIAPQMEDLGRQQGCTLTASRSCVVVRISTSGPRGALQAEILSSQDWATILRIPVAEQCIRRGLQAVTPAQGRAIMGQAMHFGVVKALLQQTLACVNAGRASESRDGPSYVSIFSGIDVGAAAMDSLFGQKWRFRLASEKVECVRKALVAAWSGKLEFCDADAFSPETRKKLWAIRGQVDVCCFSWRCAPWSVANTTDCRSEARRSSLFRAVEEIQEQIRVILLCHPKVVLMECVAGLIRIRFHKFWKWICGFLLLQAEWEWSYQVIDPQERWGECWPRKRLWVIGICRRLS